MFDGSSQQACKQSMRSLPEDHKKFVSCSSEICKRVNKGLQDVLKTSCLRAVRIFFAAHKKFC
jgi:hypothetical protein